MALVWWLDNAGSGMAVPVFIVTVIFAFVFNPFFVNLQAAWDHYFGDREKTRQDASD